LNDADLQLLGSAALLPIHRTTVCIKYIAPTMGSATNFQYGGGGMVIYRNLKLGGEGIDKYLGGGVVNMHEAQIFIKKHFKKRKIH